jgi:hypothetical protein
LASSSSTWLPRRKESFGWRMASPGGRMPNKDHWIFSRSGSVQVLLKS